MGIKNPAVGGERDRGAYLGNWEKKLEPSWLGEKITVVE